VGVELHAAHRPPPLYLDQMAECNPAVVRRPVYQSPYDHDGGEHSPALRYEVTARSGRARCSTLNMPHGAVHTPVFMPVGTQGTIKGLTTSQIEAEPLDFKIILGNTYHLAVRPGTELLDDMGGLHQFMNWDRNILTDSGGFQMVSLLQLAEITEEGVTFQSPVDGTKVRPPTRACTHAGRSRQAVPFAVLNRCC
jgi:hypothetical protein